MLGPTFRLTLSCHVSSPSPNTRRSFRHSSNRSQNKNIAPALCYNVYFHKFLLSPLACARSDYKQLWQHGRGPTATIMLRYHKALPPTPFFEKKRDEFTYQCTERLNTINTTLLSQKLFFISSLLEFCPLSCMGVKLGRWHWGRNVGWGCLRIGCWGEYLGLRGTR